MKKFNEWLEEKDNLIREGFFGGVKRFFGYMLTACGSTVAGVAGYNAYHAQIFETCKKYYHCFQQNGEACISTDFVNYLIQFMGGLAAVAAGIMLAHERRQKPQQINMKKEQLDEFVKIINSIRETQRLSLDEIVNILHTYTRGREGGESLRGEIIEEFQDAVKNPGSRIANLFRSR